MSLTIDKINELLEKSSFGFYKVYNEQTREIVAGSHVDQDNEQKAIETKELQKHFNDRMDILGYGRYKIVLKKTPTSKDEHSATYRFEVMPTTGLGAVPEPRHTGTSLNFDELERKIQQAREDERIKAQNEFDHKLKLMDLERQIAELKNGSKNNTKEVVESVFEKVVQLGVVVTSIVAPGKMGVVERALGIINAEDIDDEKPRAVHRED